MRTKMQILAFIPICLLLALHSATAQYSAEEEAEWTKFLIEYNRDYGEPDTPTPPPPQTSSTSLPGPPTQTVHPFPTDAATTRQNGSGSTGQPPAPTTTTTTTTPPPISEFEKRKQIFIANLRDVIAHNKRYERGKSSYKKKINAYGDLTYEEFVKLSGSLTPRTPPPPRTTTPPPPPLPSTAPPPLPTGAVSTTTTTTTTTTAKPPRPCSGSACYIPSTVPAKLDLRDTGCISPPKDQGFYCPACYAFTANAVLEYHMCMRNREKISFSEQEVVDCTMSYGNTGCKQGGWYDYSWSYFQHRKKVSKEPKYPYVHKETSCEPRSTVDIPDINIDVLTPYKEKAMKNYLFKHGPLAVAIHAGFGFQFYSEGVLFDDCDYDVTHAVTIVGYGKKKGKPTWIVKNSYGAKGWGDNGYVHMRRGKNQCRISSFPMGINLYENNKQPTGADCHIRNPCTAESRKANKYYFEYRYSNKFFVQCGPIDTMCYVQQCAPGTRWNKKYNLCTW